ncbi:MAG TPA: PilZ domain-containing protein [Cellvibrionaceae bacterium]
MSSADEKRHAARLPLKAYAQIISSNDRWDAHVLDISPTGARIAVLREHPFTQGTGLKLVVEFIDTASDSETLMMHGLVAHSKDHVLGLDLEPNTTSDRILLEQLLKKLTPSPQAPPPVS